VAHLWPQLQCPIYATPFTAALVRQMNEALVQVLNEPAVKSRIEEQGCDIVASTPPQYGQFLADEIEKWGRVIRANGITADS
jgi:tripartite-type tricarboxylate transporter receptor subunit TctC